MRTKVSEVPQTSYLFVLRDIKNNDILCNILLECRHSYHSSKEDTDNGYVSFDVTNVEISSEFNIVPLLKYHDSLRNDILLGNINEDLFYEYIHKFEYVRTWLNCTYKPKWEEQLGDEFFEYVYRYIKNDLYLFCCSFPGVEAFIDNIDDTEIIKCSKNESNS